MTEALSPSQALRKTIRVLLDAGYTYRGICDAVPTDYGWNENSLKQFAFRDSEARKSDKLIALANTIATLVKQEPKIDPKSSDIRSLLRALEALSTGAHEIDEALNNRFARMKHAGKNARLPSKFAFARFGREKKKIIIVLVEIRREKSCQVFSMRISGKSQRVVVGRVLQNDANTYLSGLAYPVASHMTDEVFSEVDADPYANRDLFLGAEVGLEILAVRNSDLIYEVAPATFIGLDGWGFPFAGTGVIIKEENFSDFGIAPHVLSRLDCSDKNQPLLKLLESAGGATAIPPEGGAAMLHLESIKKFAK